MSKALRWYKKDVDAWRGGTRHLTMPQRGFFGECLDAMWDIQGPLPHDMAKLSMILCCSPRTVRNLLPQLMALGKLIDGPKGLYNPRMMADIQAAKSGRVRGQFEPSSRNFASKVPENSMISTRDLELEEEEEEEYRTTQPIEPILIDSPPVSAREEKKSSSMKDIGVGGSASFDQIEPSTRAVVCGMLGITDCSIIEARFLAWERRQPLNRRAADINAKFKASAPRFFERLPAAIKATIAVRDPLADWKPKPVKPSSSLVESFGGKRRDH